MKIIKQIVKRLLTDSMVQIEPTRRCNFNCVHCTHRNHAGDIDIELYRGILQRHRTVKIVKLQGLGEPLLHPQIQLMIDLAKDSGHQVMIITNGSCRHVRNVDHYVFSLETIRPDIYAATGKRDLDRVLANIVHTAAIQKVTLNCVQCQTTTDRDVQEVRRFAEEIGAAVWLTPQEVWVDERHPDHAFQKENTLQAWRTHGVSPHYKKYRSCTWGVSEFYYDYTGAPHPCCIRMTDEYKGLMPSEAICGSCPL